MRFYELFMIAVALSMDAFAVSMCKGLAMQRLNYKNAAVISLYFGGFQALMPLLGYYLGARFERYIVNIDHYIAFALLAFLGARMIVEALRDGDTCPCGGDMLDHRELLVLAVATSIDALAVGITFAFLGADILPAVSLIGAVTFLLSFAGVAIGNRFGARFKKKAEIAGGVVLILIGLKILLEHLGALNF
ncbi:MAG: manganese efflux pump MntP family protein [Oscillospiraceae bacterium]|nr:manganese efflux pump MntP family protein [Oscillospiraceae bacterium]